MTRHILTTILLQFALFFLFSNHIPNAAQGRNGGSGVTALTKCWEVGIEAPALNALASDNIRVFFGTTTGSVQAIDAKTSGIIWTSELGGEIVSNLAVTDTTIYVVSNPLISKETAASESILRSLNKESGITNWTARLAFSQQFVLGNSQTSIIAIALDGSLNAVGNQQGNIVWKAPSFGMITARPSFSTHGTAFGTGNKQVFVISNDNGRVLFKSSTGFVPTAVSNPSSKALIVGDERGNVILLNTSTGRSGWKFKSGGGISFVSFSNNGVLVASLDNFIYMISTSNGDVVWKRRLPGRVAAGMLVLENFVFALTYSENSAFLIDSRKGEVVDQLIRDDTNYVAQIPLLVNGWNILFTTTEGIEMHSLKWCGAK